MYWFLPLLVYLVVVQPIIGKKEFAKVQIYVTDDNRVQLYQGMLISSWIPVFYLLLASWFAGISPARYFVFNVSEGNQPGIELTLPLLFTLGVFLFILLPPQFIRFFPKYNEWLKKQFAEFRALLPHSKQDQIYWVFVSLTAGIVEELLYRGFFPQFFTIYVPKLSLWVIILVVNLFFGIAHLYQGISGVFATFLTGILFHILLLASGSLLLPILLHFLIDLRILWVYSREE
jgi:membrane protease YdiL (CAAX protease family)